jgi:hypothetical protein
MTFVATLAGFVGGGVIINSLIQELPSGKEGRFWPFCVGAFSYAAVLLIMSKVS